jgi:hypothetical protein
MGKKEFPSRCGFGLRLAAPHLGEGFLVIRFGAKGLEGALAGADRCSLGFAISRKNLWELTAHLGS